MDSERVGLDDLPDPHDLDAERAVLGGILRRADHLDAREVVSLHPESFYRAVHGELFVALRELHRKGVPLDIITLRDTLGAERVDRCGGLAYIIKLPDGCPASTNVPLYAGIVAKHATNRKILEQVRSAERHILAGDADQALALLSALDEVSPRNRFTLLDDEAIATLPDEQDIIEKILPARRFGILWGETGIGKTTLIMRMLVHIASGQPSFGANVLRQGKVALIVTEGREGLRVRHDAAWQAVGVPSDKRGGIHAITEQLDLLRAEDVDGLISTLKPIAPVLLVIDGWARCLSEPDGETGTATRAVRAVDRLREALGCTVLVVHHPGWDGSRERGSYHLRASADFRWSLKSDGADDRLVLECEDNRDAEPYSKIRLRRTTVNDSVTVELADNTPPLKGKQPAVLNALQDGATRAAWAKDCVQRGVSKATAYRHIDALIDQGHVEIRGGQHFRR